VTKTLEPLELLDELEEKLKLKLLLLAEAKLKLLLELLVELLEELLEALLALDPQKTGGHGSHWHGRGRHPQPPLTWLSSSAISSRMLVSPCDGRRSAGARAAARLACRALAIERRRSPEWDRLRGPRPQCARSAT
jgi:hypothetical protein